MRALCVLLLVGCGGAASEAVIAPAPAPAVSLEPAAWPPPADLEPPGEARTDDPLRSHDAIRAVIRAHIEAVRSCYEQELTATPQLVGRITVTFVIGPDGSVRSDAHVSSEAWQGGDEPGRRVSACILEVVRTLPFAPTNVMQLVGVHYPFVLDSQPERPSSAPQDGAATTPPSDRGP
jgi:hypothetical protein